MLISSVWFYRDVPSPLAVHDYCPSSVRWTGPPRSPPFHRTSVKHYWCNAWKINLGFSSWPGRNPLTLDFLLIDKRLWNVGGHAPLFMWKCCSRSTGIRTIGLRETHLHLDACVWNQIPNSRFTLRFHRNTYYWPGRHMCKVFKVTVSSRSCQCETWWTVPARLLHKT
jgi:hypothetical protein